MLNTIMEFLMTGNKGVDILISVLLALDVCGIIAILLEVVLGLVSHFFAVKEDATVQAVRACLPGVNCGACGYSGCDQYARALADGKEFYKKTHKRSEGIVDIRVQSSRNVRVQVFIDEKEVANKVINFD